MNALMTASTDKTQVFQGVVSPISVYMMNVKTQIRSLANATNFFSIFKKSFTIVPLAFLISFTCFAVYPSCESLTILEGQAFVFALTATVSSVLSSARGQTKILTTGFTCEGDKVSSVPIMKAPPTAKPFLLASFGRKALTALFAGFNRGGILISVLFPAFARTKTLPFVIGFERGFAVVACFFHNATITCLFTKEQAQQQEVPNEGL